MKQLKLRPSIKKAVHSFPGNISYCSCSIICTNPNIDHVIPISFLRKNINSTNIKTAVNDMHNLYKCCEIENRLKGCGILGQTYITSDKTIDSYLSRSALYMDWKYGILSKNPGSNKSEKLLSKWKLMALEIKPFFFERERNEIIKDIQGNDNPFISKYPDSVKTYKT
jgi:hypothetical protein